MFITHKIFKLDIQKHHRTTFQCLPALQSTTIACLPQFIDFLQLTSFTSSLSVLKIIASVLRRTAFTLKNGAYPNQFLLGFMLSPTPQGCLQFEASVISSISFIMLQSSSTCKQFNFIYHAKVFFNLQANHAASSFASHSCRPRTLPILTSLKLTFSLNCRIKLIFSLRLHYEAYVHTDIYQTSKQLCFFNQAYPSASATIHHSNTYISTVLIIQFGQRLVCRSLSATWY